jgi:hypothetical protein
MGAMGFHRESDRLAALKPGVIDLRDEGERPLYLSPALFHAGIFRNRNLRTTQETRTRRSYLKGGALFHFLAAFTRFSFKTEAYRGTLKLLHIVLRYGKLPRINLHVVF